MQNTKPCEIPWYPPAYLKSVFLVKVSRKEQQAIKVIKEHAKGRVAVALSGKDSLVSLHLTVQSGIAPDVIISRFAGMRPLPDAVVDELADIAGSLGARVVLHDKPWDAAHAALYNIVAREYGYNIVITGLRRRENRADHAVVETYRWGVVVNPIVDWTVAEVWSYIFHHKLPVPSPYCSSLFPETSLQRLV
jgi:3'-phosphoadenosine 5'-phosphosulfate sulfotransferase (PAPS reductase)/FAD synthetase and related enzymes